MKRRLLLVSLAAALSSPAVRAAPQVPADDAPDVLATVEVVGSRIKRVDVETSQPVFVLERAQIERTGLQSVGDILQDLTTHGAALNTTVNNGGDGSTRVDLRNLGDNRTLVLVDGRRWIAGIDGAVDLNSIPLALIERIDVLKDGASAIYGSDAIAGVVNLVTRRDFAGAEALAYVGESEQGDGRVESWQATIGATSDRAAAAVGVGYVKQEPIFAGAREISAVPTFGVPGNDVRAGASTATPFGLFGFGPAGACPFDPAGNYPSNGRCQAPPGTPAAANRTTFDPGTGGYRLFRAETEGYNFAPENYLQTPQERISVFARGRYELPGDLAFSFDVLYNERRSSQQLAPSPLALGVESRGIANFVVPAGQFYNPFGQAITSFALRPVGQVRSFAQDADTWRFSAGVEGLLMVGERLWSWNLSFVQADYTIVATTRGLVNFANLRNALGPSFRDAQGVARCGTPAAPVVGCVPLDAFRGPAAVTPAMLDYLYYVGQDRTRTTSTQYAAHVSGELFELPAGPLAMAGGFEYRRDAGTSQLDAFKVAADNLGDNSYSGGLSVDEGFLELSLPLLADARFARALDLSLAARHSRYDAFGSTTNGEAGLQWRPHDDALLRASWSEGFRAPIVSELFFPIRATDGPSRNDPCAAANAITAERRAGCVADGVPGGAYVPTQSNFQVLSGGNDQLGPERAVSRTIGVVWSPSRWPDVDLSLDWYEIEVEDAIASPSVPVLLRSCVDSGIAEACARTTRSASGELQSVDARRLNSGLLAVEGWDLTARWRREARLGLFELVWDSTYTSRYDTEIPRGAPARSAVGNNVAREPGFRIRSNLDLAWRRGDWSAAAGVRWYSGLDEPCIGPVESGRSELCSHPDVVNRQFPPSPENRLGARTYVDLQASWAAPWGSQVSLGLNNAFDRDPPVSYSGVANSFDPTYPVPGRFWYLRLQHAW